MPKSGFITASPKARTSSNFSHKSQLEPLQQDTIQPPLFHRRQNMRKKSHIDDWTFLEKIFLSNLIQMERIIEPPNFHDCFHVKLPPQKCILQHELEDLSSFISQQSMLQNSKKTKCLPFVNLITKDFMPELSLVEGSYLEDIYQLKLVGLVISSDMTWSA